MTQTIPDVTRVSDAKVFAAIGDAMDHHGLDARSIDINSLMPILVYVATNSPDHVKAWADTFGATMKTHETPTSVHYTAEVQIAGRQITVTHIVTTDAYGAAYDEAMRGLRAKVATFDVAEVLDAAVDQLDPAATETTCGRCLIATGAHTFGRGCNARLEPVPVAPAAEPAAFCDCDAGDGIAHAMHTPFGVPVADHIHIVDPTSVAPGEPDDRGWDAPIVPTYVEQLGASA